MVSLTIGYILLMLHQWNFFCHSFLDSKTIGFKPASQSKAGQRQQTFKEEFNTIFPFFSTNNEQRSNTNGKEWSEHRRPENDTLGQEGSATVSFHTLDKQWWWYQSLDRWCGLEIKAILMRILGLLPGSQRVLRVAKEDHTQILIGWPEWTRRNPEF